MIATTVKVLHFKCPTCHDTTHEGTRHHWNWSDLTSPERWAIHCPTARHTHYIRPEEAEEMK